MRISLIRSRSILFALAVLAVCLELRPDAPLQQPSGLAALPHVALWSWERREDLRTADPHRFAIASLDQTVTIGVTVRSQPRRDALVYPAAARRISVVRIETTKPAVLDEEAREQVVAALLASASQPGIAALQVDFDATESQRPFYRAVLVDLRHQMPPGLPLSMTALASWCSFDNWIHDLPVDEAVPMFFRMEPDRRRAPANLEAFQIRETLCQTSVGVSTDEPWPPDTAGKHIYVFPDHGWNARTLATFQRRLP